MNKLNQRGAVQAAPYPNFNKKRIRRYYDFYLLTYIILLVGFGLVMLFSASIYSSNISLENMDSFFIKQLAFVVIGLFVMIFVSLIPYRPCAKGRMLTLYVATAIILYIGSNIAMLLVPFIGVSSHNAKRWLDIGPVTVQPSEFAKVAIIFIIPAIIEIIGTKKLNSLSGVASILITALIPAVLAWKATDNLSTALIILLIPLCLFILVNPRMWTVMIPAIMIAVVGYIRLKGYAEGLAAAVSSEAEITSFRVRRLIAWADPDKFILGSGWQVIQGLYAIGSGGIWGKGLGNSTQKFNNIPEAQNDFIFSIICEELGFFGALMVVILFVGILLRLIFIAVNVRHDSFAYNIILSIFLHLSIQVIFNISVVLNLIPTTGISLPFISSGGTALIATMGEMGVALAISRSIILNE